MTPSTEELDAGQKAYQRIKTFGRYKTTPVTWGICLLWIGNLVRIEIHDGRFGVAIFWTVLFATFVWKHCRQKARHEKDYELLEHLKTKYGPEIYSEIKKEPSSFYYRVFQKLYPPDSRRVSVALP